MELKLTLDQPTIYQIKAAGCISSDWSDWIEDITIKIEGKETCSPITILTGTFDQAALLGLLRRIYYLGLPLISVNHIKQDC